MISLFFNNAGRGPGKVSKNLILGLSKLGVEFDVNPNHVSNEDKIISLQPTNIMNSHYISQSIIGPNICILPFENSVVMEQKYKKIIVPSEWVKNKYKKWITEDKIFVWAVGIDTDLFPDVSNHSKTNDCLIYFKNRNHKDLEMVKEFLKSKGQSFEVISYGSYSENEFINTIKKSKYGVVIGNTESQGIAIQEMMSSNLPLLVWDTIIWDGKGPDYLFPATTVPYWSDECGVKFTEFSELEEQYLIFLEKMNIFTPRNYIINNLSLEKKAKDLINEFND